MAKITDETTFGQFSIEKSLLGIETVTMMVDPDTGGRIATVSHSSFGVRMGSGVTEAEALDAAFERIRKAMAATYKTA